MTVLFTASPAMAFRAAQVSSDQAELKDSPGDEAGTKAALPQGTRVNTSDQPTNGYYRVRSATDTGWVRESDLQFSGSAPAPSRSRKQVAERMEDRDHEEQQTGSSQAKGGGWDVKAFGGMDFWTPSDINNLVQSTGLNNGVGYGGELDYWFSKDFFLGFRIEKLSKSTNGPSGNGVNVALSLSSTPLTVGLGANLAKGDHFSLDIGGFVGGGLSTNVTETDSTSSNNVTSLTATAPTFLLLADINWHITQPLWFFVEPGYRYLKTSSQTPQTVGTGALLTQNGKAVPFSIDLSGVILNFGIRLNF